MSGKDGSNDGRANPFGSLIAASWIIVAILYAAGFSYRWSYYYNFGAQHLVLQQSVQSFLMAAMELIRQPRSAMLTVLWVLLPLALLNGLLAFLSSQMSTRRKATRVLVSMLGLDSLFLRDALRATVLLYGCFMVSSEIGWSAFRRDVVDSPSNVLPRVTLLFAGDTTDGAAALGCGQADLEHVKIVGDAESIATLQDSHQTCNSETRTWRLLYRDDQFIYVFASQRADIIAGARPTTIMVPNDSRAFVVTQ